tara:strand:+ start:5011 stop:5481 length:471 start_codon:yes stop_codon:yes gene_type:complete
MAELNFQILEPADDSPMSFDPLPDGWYSAAVVDEEKRQSAAGNSYLSVTFEVTGPDHAGRKIWSNFNLWHPDEKVLDIAQRQFSDMALACGLSSCKDTTELLGNHLDIMLKTDPGNGDFGPKNKVVAYRAAPQPTVRPFDASTAATPDVDSPPWAN